MANGDNTLQVLVEIKSKMDELQAVIKGLDDLKNKTTEVSTASASSIGLFTAAWQKLAEAIQEAVHKASEALVSLAEDSIKTAASIQEQQTALTNILQDHGKVAQEVLGGVESAWQRIGVVSRESLAESARQLAAVGVPAENITARLIELSKVSVGSVQGLDTVTSAYIRMRTAIEHEAPIIITRVGQVGIASRLLGEELEKSLGVKGTAALNEMSKNGQISIQQLNEALRAATTEGGRFANAFTIRKEEFNGAVEAMKTAWQELEAELGKPLITQLTPLINKVTDFARALAKVGQDTEWQTVLIAAWDLVLNKIIAMIGPALVTAFKEAGPIAAEAFFGGFGKFVADHPLLGALVPGLSNIAQVGGLVADTFFDGYTQRQKDRIAKAEKDLQDAMATFAKDHPTVEPGPELAEQTNRAADAAKNAKVEFTELENALRKVREEQQLLSKAPFLGADEKNRALIQLTVREIQLLSTELTKAQAEQAKFSQGSVEWQKLEGKIDETKNKLQGLGLELLKLTHSFQTSMQQWVNSWGDFGQQVAQTVQGTINNALESMNEFLVTGKFNAQQLLQSIARLGLQLIEHLILQQAVSAMNSKLAAAQAAILGPAIAAEMAGAATAMTIATQGEAAAQAPFSIGAALATIKALLVGGSAGSFHEGGMIVRRMHNGGLAHDEVPIIAQTGEIMIRRSVAQAHRDFLLALNAGSMHNGGHVPWLLQRDIPRGHHHGGAGGGSEGGLPGSAEGGPFSYIGQGAGGGGGDLHIFRLRHWGGLIMHNGGNLPSHLMLRDFIRGHHRGGIGGASVGGVSMAGPANVSFGLFSGGSGGMGSGGTLKLVHRGGEIGRYHDGGTVGGSRAGGIHIYAFTDLKALTQHMASREGQKIIFDTVRGNRINLGL